MCSERRTLGCCGETVKFNHHFNGIEQLPTAATETHTLNLKKDKPAGSSSDRNNEWHCNLL